VAPGSDADIVVWDPSTPSTLTLEDINDGLDWSPYDGLSIPGTLRHVLARGDLVVEDVRWTGTDHRGEYLPVRRVRAPL
jgi:dihydropyrimidinase